MNVLLSSVGRRGYLVEYFRSALKGSGKVVAANTVPDTPGMVAADIAEVAPHGADPQFVDFLLDLCRRHAIDILFSLHDWEAPYIAAARERFIEAGVIPVVPSLETVRICLDKFATWQFMQQHGILSPASFLSLDEAQAALDSGAINFPLVVKPRFGQGSIETQKVEDREELRAAHQLVTSRLRRTSAIPFQREASAGLVLVQAFVEGREYGVDIVNDLEGNIAAVFVKRKFAMRSGETDIAETVDCPAVAAVARRIATLTRHPGILDADFFIDGENRVWLLEMNPRFGGGYPFSHVAGCDVPGALIAWAQGLRPDPSMLNVRIGVRAFKNIQLVVSGVVSEADTSPKAVASEPANRKSAAGPMIGAGKP